MSIPPVDQQRGHGSARSKDLLSSKEMKVERILRPDHPPRSWIHCDGGGTTPIF